MPEQHPKLQVIERGASATDALSIGALAPLIGFRFLSQLYKTEIPAN